MDSLPDRLSSLKEHRGISLVLFLGALHGLIYIFLMPPWQHYDEPTHFEYAWLLARGNGLFETAPRDQGLRREIAASMIEHDFFKKLDFRPNLLSQTEPIWIGIDQTNDQPLYHYIVSLPLRLVSSADVTTQLYIARFVSLGFYLLTLSAAYGLMVKITPDGHALRWLVPMTLVLLPGFVELMTAINNDVGATALFSLFLWVGVRTIKQGFSWVGLALLIFLAFLCLQTKQTIAITPLLAVLILVVAFFRNRNLGITWYAMGAAVLFGTVGTLGWGDAAHWLRSTPQPESTRARVVQAPQEEHAFRVVLRPERSSPRIVQILPNDQIEALRGRQYTLGVWTWADTPGEYRIPLVDDGHSTNFVNERLTNQPQFFQFNGRISSEATQVSVVLAPLRQSLDQPVTVYYDGIVLVPADIPPGSEPQFTDRKAARGTWAGVEFINQLENGSAEDGWPWVRMRFDELIGEFAPANPSLLLGAILDWRVFSGYFRITVLHITRTFWGMFGWAHVPLRGFHPYLILGLVTLAGIGGSASFLWRIRRRIHWGVAILFCVSLGLIWGATLLRGIPSMITGNLLIPAARYAFPAIVPTGLILVMGWWELLKLAGNQVRASTKTLISIYCLLFAVLDIWAIYSIWHYYRI